MSGARLLTLLFAGSLSLTGCQRQDAERLGKFGHKFEEKVGNWAAGSDQRIVRTWQTLPLQLGAVALDVRVSARLHWDKALAESAIEVRAIDDGVELKGRVRDEQQKRRAIEVAEGTLGVSKVVEKLEIKTEPPPGKNP